MCKYCESELPDLISENVNFGESEFALDVSLYYYPEDNNGGQICAWFFNGDTTVVSGQIKINYCPMCGRKFKEE